jgi:glycosyltransferase involved in cell wall biosynthesis
MGAYTPENQAFLRALRRRITELLHDGQQLVLHAAQKILVISQGEGKILQEEFGVPHDKLQLTYYGVEPKYEQGDAARFEREFGVSDFVYCAARYEERKNHIGIIRAWRDEKVPLVLAGPVPDPRYFDLCRGEATSNVHFVGALTPAQIADAAAAAKVHVLASWWEEMGLAAMEAGLAGCNLVMTQNGPGREYFGDDCFSVDPADPASIRAGIQAALARPRATHLAQKIREQFTWEDSARATREAYDEVLESGAVPHIDPEALMKVAIRMSEEYILMEQHQTGLSVWAHDMERRLKQPPSVQVALRHWVERLRTGQ